MLSVIFLNYEGSVQLEIESLMVSYCQTVPGLLHEVLRKRLGNEEDYEADFCVIVYEDKGQQLNLEELQLLVLKFLPCLNLTVTSITNLPAVLEQIERFQEWRFDSKIVASHYWMYFGDENFKIKHDPSIINVYSMMKHLAQSSNDQDEQNNKVLSYLYQNLRVESFMHVPHGRQHYTSILRTWYFDAHSLNIFELIECASIIITELCNRSEIPCISQKALKILLIHLECAYHQLNKFHNFRHAVDVMQATYQLCRLLKPDYSLSLALCISALGHDVGHSGTNNKLFSSFGSPLSKLYSGLSILENFHYDIFTCILRLHWPEYCTSMNMKTIHDAIISTDMALHDHYLEGLRFADTESLKKDIPLLSSLIIKAADISNVSRSLLVSSQWAVLLSYEFKECMLLEQRLKSPTSLDIYENMPNPSTKMGTTVSEILDQYPGIPECQLFFINSFVEGLFAGLAEKFHELEFIYHNIQENKRFWLQQ